MVSPTGTATQSVPAQQPPTFSAGAETRANTEQVQPRQAPAADSQRADQRSLQSREDEKRQTERRDDNRREEETQQARREENRRGSLVDVTA